MIKNKPEYIERQYAVKTFMGLGPYLLFLAVVLGYTSINSIVYSSWPPAGNAPYIIIAIFTACFLVLGYVLMRYLRISKIVKRRKAELERLARQNGWQAIVPSLTIGPQVMGNSSLLHIADRDLLYTNSYTSKDWSYTDLEYAVYRQLKNGEYKEAKIFYAVISTVLPRKLPNVVFDSKKQRGRQFKTIFDSKQLHRLEGNFDNYFATYFAETYTIDSLSFITPDVMLALIDASDYDIEIVGDRLLMYGPVYAPSLQVAEMAQKLAAIKKQLLDNILTYRDQRLPYAEGRQTVTPQGMFLKRRKEGIWLTVAVIVIYIILEFMDNSQ